jgi:putative PEP-CTERM system TPR-repeat lipoprotein
MFSLKKYNLLLASIFLFAVNQSAFSQSTGYEDALQAYQLKNTKTAHIHLKNALKQNPNNLPAKLLLAEVLIDLQDYQLAELTLRDALIKGADFNLVLEPLGRSLLLQSKFDDVLSYTDNNQLNQTSQIAYSLLRAKAYRNKNQTELAISEYETLLFLLPNNIDAMIGLASILIYADEIETALPLLTKVDTLTDNNSKLWQLKGLVAQKNGLLAEAITAFKKANALENNNLMTLRMMASTYIQQEDLEKADDFLEQILTLYPFDPQARFMRSSILKSTNNDELADQILMELSNQLSNVDVSYLKSSPQLQLIDAMTDYAQKNWQQASNKFKYYLKENPTDINVMVMLADAYIKLDEPTLALELLSEHEGKLLNNKGFSLLLVGLYMEFDSKFKAEYLLTELRKLYPDDPTVLILLAELLDSMNQSESALSLLENNPIKDNYNYIHILAAISLSAGKFEQSLFHLTTLLNDSPENIDYLILKAKVLFEVNQFEKAADLITALYKKHSDIKVVIENYIFLQLELGNTTTARALFKNLLDKYPEDTNNWLMFANIEHTLGNSADAIEILKRQTRDQQYKREAMFQLANIYYEQHAFEESLSYANTLLKDNRLDGDAIALKTRNLIALKRNEKSIHQLKILKGLWQKDGYNLLKLSHLQRQVKDYSGAEQSLDRAILLKPNSLSIVLTTIELKIRINKLTQASQLITQVEKQSDNEFIVLNLFKGDIAKAKNDFDQAFNYYLQVLKRDEINKMALLKLDKVSHNKIRAEKFASYLINILKQYPQRSFQRNVLADILIRQEKYEQAKYQYELLLTHDISIEKRGIALNNLANIYLHEHDYKTAVNYSQQAVKLIKGVPAFLDTAGWALTLSGELSDGLSYLRHAFTISSSNTEIQYHIAYSLVQLNRHQEAKDILEKQLSLSNDFAEIELAKNLLNSINNVNLN